MTDRKRIVLWTLVVLLILAALACNFPGFAGGNDDASPEPAITNTPLPFASDTPEPTQDPAAIVIPTITPDGQEPEEEAPTGDDECEFRAAFLEDITIPDDTEVDPDESFDKTWRIHNSGTCDWVEGTVLAFVSGDALGDVDSITVPATAPDGVLNVTVAMTAPADPGTYRSNWQLQTPDGRRYGGIFYAKIVVPGEESEGTDPEPEPTAVAVTAPSDFLGAVAADCSEAVFSWSDGQGESAYNIRGDSLDIDISADSTSFTWDNPPDGTSDVILKALDADEDEIAQVKTTIAVTCGAGEADLAVISVTLSPTVPVAHMPVTATVRIENAGTADAGGFKALWRAIKTSPNTTCAWVVAGGLDAGDTVDLACTAIAYSAPYAGMVGYAEADTTDIIAESDEDNNDLEPTTPVVTPEIVYDFVANADEGTWISAPPTADLPWAGDTASDLGYARLTGGTLETGGTIQGLCLETHPRRVAEGIVRGEFEDIDSPDYVIEPGDRIRAAVGMMQGAENGAISYRVMAILSEAGGKWLIDEPHAYGEGIEALSADLTPYAGQEAAVILQVEAGPDATDDQACWIIAQILRYP